MHSQSRGWPRGRLTRLGAAVGAGLWLAPQLATAADPEVEEQLRRMNERLNQLEQRLEVTTDELVEAQRTVDEQQEVIERAGLAEEQEDSKSALSAFLEQTEFSGWVAASYNYNFRDNDNDGNVGQNGGANGTHLPFHQDANTFALNQLWFTLDKDVDEESRAGFHVDLLFGQDAEVLGGSGGSIFRAANSGGNDGVELFTAYASYLAPVLDGIRFDAGELPTLIGAEVVQTTHNFNITRGLLWSFQPVTHTGVISSTRFDNGFGMALGFVNDGYTDINRDNDNDKGITAQLSLVEETYTAAVSFIYGSPAFDIGGAFRSNEEDRVGMVDVLLTADLSDRLSWWLNFDWGFRRDDSFQPTPGAEAVDVKNSDFFGIALAGRYEFIEGTGVSLRGEWLTEDDGYFQIANSGGESTFWTLTTTLDHALTENLMARIEGRFDWVDVDEGKNDYFINSHGNVKKSDQYVALAELVYSF